MIKKKIKNHDVLIYNSIEELPITRFNKYNKFLLIDAGIGGDLNAVDAHLTKAVAYIKNNDNQSASIELENLRQNIYLINSGINTQHLALATLIHSIDGHECNDLSDDGIIETLSKISDISVKEFREILDGAKKKFDDELKLYFPSFFDNADAKEFYDTLKRRTIAILDGIINGNNNDNDLRVEKLTLNLLTYNKPQTFTGANNAEVAHDKAFENICVQLSQHLNIKPKTMSVLEFYNAIEYIRQQASKNKAK